MRSNINDLIKSIYIKKRPQKYNFLRPNSFMKLTARASDS